MLVPVVAVDATLIFTTADPDPGAAIVEGVMVNVTPVGTPVALREIAELKPPFTWETILVWPLAPRATVTIFGVTPIWKLPLVVLVTVSETVVVSVVLPAVPVTVIVKVPGVTVDPTAIVMVEVPLPVIEVGLKLTVTPLGWPLALKTTAVLKPPVTVLVMVDVPDAPCATETEVGLAERLNPEVVPVPASESTRA